MKERYCEARELELGEQFQVAFEIYYPHMPIESLQWHTVFHMKRLPRNPPQSLPPFPPCLVRIACDDLDGLVYTIPGSMLVERKV